MLSGSHKPIPVLLDIVGRTTHLSDRDGNFFGGHHINRVPWADLDVVGILFLARDMHADLAADAPLNVDFAPALQVV